MVASHWSMKPQKGLVRVDQSLLTTQARTKATRLIRCTGSCWT